MASLIERLECALHCHAFEPLNEIGYLALTGKVEGRVRDNVAWALHRQLSNEEPRLLVAREWSAKPGEVDAYRRVDLAILNERGKPALLVEFKAMYDGVTEIDILDRFSKAVEEDLVKCGIGECPFAAVFVAPAIKCKAEDREIIGKYRRQKIGEGRTVGASVKERFGEGHNVREGKSPGDEKYIDSFSWWIIERSVEPITS